MEMTRMLCSTLTSACRRAAALFVAGVMVPAGWAQDASQMPNAPSAQVQKAAPSTAQPFEIKDYAQPRSHFPNPIGPYKPRNVAPPSLANTDRITQLMRDGKLYISMNDAVALALENNLDIAIARYNLNIADTDIWRAKAGQATRGVNTGVVQGTPGGTGTGVGSTSTGGGAGGTTAGTGGAGAGTSGLVTSTSGVGAAIPSFDPILTGTLQLDQTRVLTGQSSQISDQFFDTHTATGDFGYQQGFHWGTNLAVGFNNQRNTSASTFQTRSPQLTSNFRASISQPLLSGFGLLPNTRFIRIAKNNREISDVAFRLQVITTVNQIQNIYWDLVNAYENVKVQQDSLALANKTLSDSQTQVDPVLADAEVIPTDTMLVPDNEPVVPIQDLVNEALSHRTELAESRI